MRKIKSYVIDLFNEGRYGYKGISRTQNADFWTSDTDAWLRFKIATQSVVISSAQINLYNKNDKSLVVEEDMTIVNNEAEFKMSEALIEHFGHWSVQVIFIINGKEHTSPTVEFRVLRELGADLPEKLGIISDWKDLDNELREFIAEVEKFTAEDFVELKMGEKLQNLEVDYATRLTGLETKDTQLTAQLAQKTTKGEVNINHFDEPTRQTFLEAQGIDVNYVLGEENVTPVNTTFFKVGKNLFNKNAVTNGKILSSFGAPIDGADYSTTDFFEIKANQDYSNTSLWMVWLYDASKTPIHRAMGATFTTPANAVFVRITVRNIDLEIAQLEEGGARTAYEPFRYYIPNGYTEKHKIEKGDLEEKSVTPKETTFIEQAKNLLNKRKFEDGYFVSQTTGVKTPHADHMINEGIRVTPGTSYFLGDAVTPRHAFYTETGEFISGGVEEYTVVAPPYSSTMTVSYNNKQSSKDVIQVEVGSSGTEYEEYGYYFHDEILTNNNTKEINDLKTMMYTSYYFMVLYYDNHSF